MSLYPQLDAWPDLPVATRMVLESDGSTTLLLQILAASPLHAELVTGPQPGADTIASAYLAAVFPASGAAELAVRHSRLRDQTGHIVSENLIVYRKADQATIIPADNTPFGLHIRRLGLYERRSILCAGLTHEEFGLIPRSAPGRIYELGFSSGQRVLIHEAFNPRIVPAGNAAGAFQPSMAAA